jgi:hypothetical protein
MTQPFTTATPVRRNGERRALIAGLVLVGIALVVLAIAILVSGKAKQTAPAEKSIDVPRMRNVPPPSQRMIPRER